MLFIVPLFSKNVRGTVSKQFCRMMNKSFERLTLYLLEVKCIILQHTFFQTLLPVNNEHIHLLTHHGSVNMELLTHSFCLRKKRRSKTIVVDVITVTTDATFYSTFVHSTNAVTFQSKINTDIINNATHSFILTTSFKYEHNCL